MASRLSRSIGLAVFTALIAHLAQAQEVPPGDPSASTEKDTGPYAPLAKSTNRSTQLLVERYRNLIRLQEWSSATGTSKIGARYVAHDPDLKWVKLAVVKGSGKTREVREVQVDVAKLSRTCQTRVKQIDLLQKKLDELMAQEPGATQPGVLGGAPMDPGAPMTDDRGAEPGAAIPGPYDQPPGGAVAAGVPGPDSADTAPGADQEDPLGFAEVPEVPAPEGATGPPGGFSSFPPGAAFQLPGGAGPAIADPTKWKTSYEGFRANFTSSPGPEGGISWGSLTALKEAADEVQKWEATGSVGENEKKAIAEKFAAVGEFTWEATLAEADVSSGDWTARLNLPPLPEPFSIGFKLDRERDPGNWQALKTGDRVRFIGRFTDIENGNDIVASIRFPEQR
jgi:hypothetical protein